MKCHIRPILFEIRFEFESLLPIRFVFDSNANGRFAGPYNKSTTNPQQVHNFWLLVGGVAQWLAEFVA